MSYMPLAAARPASAKHCLLAATFVRAQAEHWHSFHYNRFQRLQPCLGHASWPPGHLLPAALTSTHRIDRASHHYKRRATPTRRANEK